MISISDELITLSEACKLLPKRRSGSRPHLSTLLRWAKVGVRGEKLEVCRVASTLCTTRAALDDFFHRLNEAKETSAPSRALRTDPRVERELDEAGIK